MQQEPNRLCMFRNVTIHSHTHTLTHTHTNTHAHTYPSLSLALPLCGDRLALAAHAIMACYRQARRYVAAGDDWRAYRLLQLALIYVFTLRNALRVPEDAARDWATRTDLIVSEIKILKERSG